ncbi:MAG: hypothetical protein ACP5TK_00055 [Candidatus Micrarchaeia archaeon]
MDKGVSAEDIYESVKDAENSLKIDISSSSAWEAAYAKKLLAVAKLSFSYFGTFTGIDLGRPYLVMIDYEKDDILGSFNSAVPEGMGFLGGVITMYPKSLAKDKMMLKSPKQFVSESLITLAHEYTHATLAKIGAHRGMRDGFPRILDESVANFVSRLFAQKIGIINFSKYEKTPGKLASVQQIREIFAEIYAEEWMRQNGSDIDSAAILFTEEVIERMEQMCYAIYESSGGVGPFLKTISTIETVEDFRNEIARATKARTSILKRVTRK